MKNHFEDIPPEKTAHGVGNKFVFLRKENVLSQLTQVAIGVITSKDDIENHIHYTMEEFYFFLEGEATFILENEFIPCKEATFVFVPINTNHKIITNNMIKFLYWGVAI